MRFIALDDKIEILKCLIENRALASSHAVLEKELGYKGRMTIYRLMDSSVKDGIIDKMWNILYISV